MKIILGLSVLLNVVLGYLLVMRKPETQIIERERLIIESHSKNEGLETQSVSLKAAALAPIVEEEKKGSESYAEPAFLDAGNFEEVSEKLESDRSEFLQSLGMSEEKISEHNKLREEFHRESAAFWKKNPPMSELSFDERRKMIDLEEEFHTKLSELHGKENWEQYQKFRESYNHQGFKKQVEENRPFLYMGI